MYSFEHYITTNARKESIWKVWSKIEEWHLWDHKIKDASITGEFAIGSKIKLELKNGRKVSATITDCQYLKSFSDITKLPLCKITFIHHLENINDCNKITHRVEFSGLLSFIFAKFIGKKINENMPIALENLVKLAEEREILQ